MARDYEGFTNRDLFSTTALITRTGKSFTFMSTTGVVDWSTHDSTDLDYTPLPLTVRDNKEEDIQFTQEVRFASTPSATLKLSDSIGLRWQAGAMVFTQNYDQLASQQHRAGRAVAVHPLRGGEHVASGRAR